MHIELNTPKKGRCLWLCSRASSAFTSCPKHLDRKNRTDSKKKCPQTHFLFKYLGTEEREETHSEAISVWTASRAWAHRLWLPRSGWQTEAGSSALSTSLWKGGLEQKYNALRRHSAWQMSVIYWLCTCVCVCVCMSVQMLNNARLPGRWFLGSNCIPVRERHKTEISGVCAALNDSCDLYSHPDIQMYTCTHLHTPTHSVLICLNTHGSDARARSGSGRLPKAAIISRQILFKNVNLFRPSLPKLFTKDLVRLVWEPTPGGSHLHLFHLTCYSGRHFWQRWEPFFAAGAWLLAKKKDIPGVCGWRTRQMMRSLPMLTTTRCLKCQMWGVQILLKLKSCKIRSSKIAHVVIKFMIPLGVTGGCTYGQSALCEFGTLHKGTLAVLWGCSRTFPYYQNPSHVSSAPGLELGTLLPTAWATRCFIIVLSIKPSTVCVYNVFHIPPSQINTLASTVNT